MMSALEKSGATAAALAAADEGVRQVPQNSGLHRQRGMLLRLQLEHLIHAHPPAVFAYELIARVALQAGDRAAGLDYIARGLMAARAQSNRARDESLLRLQARVRKAGRRAGTECSATNGGMFA